MIDLDLHGKSDFLKRCLYSGIPGLFLIGSLSIFTVKYFIIKCLYRNIFQGLQECPKYIYFKEAFYEQYLRLCTREYKRSK